MEVLDALILAAAGKGQVWALRQWELETINALGWREEDWALLPINERYHKVCALKLGEWLGALETQEEIKRIKAMQ